MPLLDIAGLVIRHQLTARERADAIAARMDRLREVVVALSDAATSADVARVVIHQGLDVLDATLGLIAIVDGDDLRALDSRTSPATASGTAPKLTIAKDGPVAEAVRRREPVWLESRERFRELFPEAHDRVLPGLSANAFLAVPLLHGPDLVGALVLGFEAPSAFGATDRNFALLLAQAAAAALARAGAFDHEREARQKAEAMSHAREEVLGVVVHDLRNPLGAIGGTITMLRDLELDPSEREQLLATATRAVQRMQRLVGDLLDITRIENGRLALVTQELTVASLLADAADGIRQQAVEQGIALTVLPTPADVRVQGDGGRLAQVLGNLLGNAVKFTPQGGQVTLRSWPKPGRIVFEVADNGPGVSRENCAHLFDAFWQVRASDRRGLGLGLAISRAIVEAHGGQIWVDSEIGVGSRFCFAIPTPPARVTA